ncbi:MAG: acyl-CoA reductase [Sandaracinaceae bacterium]
MSDPATLTSIVDGESRAGDALRARDPASIAASVADAWRAVREDDRGLRAAIARSSGLSEAGVAWGLETTLDDLDEQLARAAAAVASVPHEPARLGALVLAGNVFSAAVAPLSFALLARVPIVAKASTKDDSLPRAFAESLAAIDPELARACAVVSFAGGEVDAEAALLERARIVVAYGSDATMDAIRARAPSDAAFVGHGHGLGVGVIRADARVRLTELARAFAVDVAAYDQRGCLSPHAIVVEGDLARARAFAVALVDALDALEATLPRGELPLSVGASQLAWRGLAATRGELFEARRAAVAVDHDPAAIAPSPGWRNVRVIAAPTAEAIAGRLASLGGYLKALGLAGSPLALAAGVVPRVAEPGAMQRPRLTDPHDGDLPWQDWLRISASSVG